MTDEACREAFEKWAGQHYGMRLTLRDDGLYEYGPTAMHWNVWQAAWTARAGRGDSCPTCELRLRMLRAYEAERSSGVPVAWSRSRTIDNAEGCPIGTDEPELAWGKEPPDDTGWSPLYAHRSPSDREALDVDAVSARIARAIFACGDEPHSKTWRIQFMGGNQWHERGNGGLNEEALARLIARALMVRP